MLSCCATTNLFYFHLITAVQDSDSGEQYGDRAGGLAASLHAPRLPLPTGVRRHPQTDRHL